jgi:lauroyl/myristoyl acyltransferase
LPATCLWMAHLRPIQRLLDLSVQAIGAIPLRVAVPVAAVIGRAGYVLYGAQRRLVLWNLAHCYGLQPSRWRRATALAYFEHVVMCAYEVCRAVRDPDDMRAQILIEHPERLHKALAAGKGVVAVAGHHGNFALIPFALRGCSPDAAFIARAPDQRSGPIAATANAYYRDSLKPLARLRVLPSTRAGLREAGRLLSAGNLVLVFADLTWGMGETPVRLLGVDHHVSRAPASLALRTGAVLLPMFIRRLPDGTHRLSIQEPLVPPEVSQSRASAERIMMEQFARRLECWLRTSCEQWYWMHESWRRQEQGSG